MDIEERQKMIKRTLFLFLKLFLTQTERGFCILFAFGVLLCSFILFLANSDGWQCGLIGISCLAVLKTRDIFDGFQGLFFSKNKTTSLNESVFDKKDFIFLQKLLTDTKTQRLCLKNIHQKALLSKQTLCRFLQNRYQLPDFLAKKLENPSLTDIQKTFGFYIPNASFYLAVLSFLNDVIALSDTKNPPF